jgi:hypothetical protein
MIGEENPMKTLPAVVVLFLAAGLGVRAQTVVTPQMALHPIMKDGQRNAPTSLNQDPALAAEYRNKPSMRVPVYANPNQVPGQPAEPAVIVAKVDATLGVSPVSVIGTLNGLKGKFYVTNLSSDVVIPKAELAVCNAKGFKIGSAKKDGEALSPNESEKIEVLATNVDAVDLKLMKLTAAH